MNSVYDSEYCRVSYDKQYNIVLLAWKKFCCFEDYRKPTLFASQLLNENAGSSLVIDARNGFEDVKEDVEWGFQVLLPDMAKSGCRKCVFIKNEITDIEEEIDLWTAEFQKYFRVYKVLSYEEAAGSVTEN